MTEDKATTLDKICFVISPIGREGTDIHLRFREVLDYVIRPAVQDPGYGLQVLRADDIERAGSFIKDILEYVSGAHVVIADLTGQNANVFYELGVRHSLSSRTILIAQSLDDIPSDLREYRTIIYDTSAKGATTFKERIDKYLKDIAQEPDRADNPVLDRLGSVLEERTRELALQVVDLRSQLEQVLKKGALTPRAPSREGAYSRVTRILELFGAQEKILGGTFTRKVNGVETEFSLPSRQGNFALYFQKDGKKIKAFWYVSTPVGTWNIAKEFADLRVLIEKCSKGQEAGIKFVIATDETLGEEKAAILKAFEKMKKFVPTEYRKLFSLEIWDDETLTREEKELGIKIDLAESK